MTEHDGSGVRTGSEARPDRPADDYPSLRRNWTFVRFLVGRLVTNAGDSLYAVAILWLVFRLTESTVFTGVAEALLLLPWVLQVVAGPVVDRLPIARLLVGAQFGQGLVVLVLPVAASTGYLSVWLVLAVVPVLALLTLVVGPAQAALVPRIVADDQLARSNSLLATVTLGLDMVFEAVGGVFVALVGPVALFVADALTFVVAGVLFGGMAVPPAEGEDRDASGTSEPSDEEDEPDEPDGSDEPSEPNGSDEPDEPSEPNGSDEPDEPNEPNEPSEPSDPDDPDEPGEADSPGYLDDLRAGVAVLRGTVFVEMLLVSVVVNFAVGATLAVLPAYGALRGGPATYGLLLGAIGVGRVGGSVAASYLTDLPYGWLRATMALGGAVLWLASVYTPSRTLAVGLFGLAWVSAGVNGVLVTTLNQRAFPEHLLGRVAATKGTVATATLPVGSLVGGLVGAVVGPAATMGLAAGGFGFAGVYFLARRSLRTLPPTSAAGPEDFGVEQPDETGE